MPFGSNWWCWMATSAFWRRVSRSTLRSGLCEWSFGDIQGVCHCSPQNRLVGPLGVGRQNTVGERSQRHTLPSCYKNGFMLGLIWGVFTWLRSFIRSRHDLGLEIAALRQQLIVLKRRTKRAHFWVLLRRV